MKNEDNEFLEFLAEVKSRLAEKGASQVVQEYVEDLLVKQHQAYHEKSALEAAKMLNLLEIVREIEVSSSLIEILSEEGVIKALLHGSVAFNESWARRGPTSFFPA